MFAGFAFTRRCFVSGIVVLAAASAASLFTAKATAQTAVEAAKVAAEINRVASNLPPESRDVITRLTMLRELPGGAWKMHAGDLAHGEEVSLDESGWETFAYRAKRRTMRCGFGRRMLFPTRSTATI